jgi:hypothetical protein
LQPWNGRPNAKPLTRLEQLAKYAGSPWPGPGFVGVDADHVRAWLRAEIERRWAALVLAEPTAEVGHLAKRDELARAA